EENKRRHQIHGEDCTHKSAEQEVSEDGTDPVFPDFLLFLNFLDQLSGRLKLHLRYPPPRRTDARGALPTHQVYLKRPHCRVPKCPIRTRLTIPWCRNHKTNCPLHTLD